MPTAKQKTPENESGAIAGLFSVERREVAARCAAQLVSYHTAGLGNPPAASLPPTEGRVWLWRGAVEHREPSSASAVALLWRSGEMHSAWEV